MKSIVLIVLVYVIVGRTCCEARSNNNTTTVDCSEAARVHIDTKLLKLTAFGPRGRPFPTNHQELKGFCGETRKLVAEVELFINTCFKDNVKSLAKVMFFTIKGIERKFCRRKVSKKLAALLSAAPCANRYLRPNTTCLDNYTKTLERIVHLPANYNAKKMNYVCCGYVDMLDCLNGLMDTKQCLRRTRGIQLDFFKSLFQSSVDVVCGEYNDDTDRCDLLGAVPILGPLPAKRKVYHTQMFPIIDILNSF